MSISIGYTCWRCEFYGWFLILSLGFLIFFKFFTINTYWYYFIVMMNIFKHSMFVFQNHISVLTHTKILSTVPPKLLTANCCQTENSQFCAYTIQSLEQNIGPHTWTLIIKLWHFSAFLICNKDLRSERLWGPPSFSRPWASLWYKAPAGNCGLSF